MPDAPDKSPSHTSATIDMESMDVKYQAISRQGYGEVAYMMALKGSEFAILRKFRQMSMLNLLSLQADLIRLRERLDNYYQERKTKTKDEEQRDEEQKDEERREKFPYSFNEMWMWHREHKKHDKRLEKLEKDDEEERRMKRILHDVGNGVDDEDDEEEDKDEDEDKDDDIEDEEDRDCPYCVFLQIRSKLEQYRS